MFDLCREALSRININFLHRNIMLYIKAFNAHMTSTTTPTPGQTVQFGTETLDVGNGYNPTTSVYTAPLDGTYTFTWRIKIYNSGYYITELRVNNNVKDYLITRSDDTGGHTYNTVTTATTVVSLHKDDRVYIHVQRRSQSATMISDTTGYCTFSGWMLH